MNYCVFWILIKTGSYRAIRTKYRMISDSIASFTRQYRIRLVKTITEGKVSAKKPLHLRLQLGIPSEAEFSLVATRLGESPKASKIYRLSLSLLVKSLRFDRSRQCPPD